MIHGLRGTHHGLEPIARRLADMRVIIPDLPGFGASTPLAGYAHDIESYSEFVQVFIAKLGLKKPLLLGHSFGSIITARVAAEQPKGIRKLILVNPISTPALEGPRGILSRFAMAYYWLGHTLPEVLGVALLSNPAMVLGISRLMIKTRDKALRKLIHRSHLEHFSSFQTRDALYEAFIASTQHTAADPAEAISMPTLLIAGAVDDIAPLTGQQPFAERLPQGKLAVIQGVGHLIHHEAPEEAARIIRHFISQRSSDLPNRE